MDREIREESSFTKSREIMSDYFNSVFNHFHIPNYTSNLTSKDAPSSEIEQKIMKEYFEASFNPFYTSENEETCLETTKTPEDIVNRFFNDFSSTPPTNIKSTRDYQREREENKAYHQKLREECDRQKKVLEDCSEVLSKPIEKIKYD